MRLTRTIRTILLTATLVLTAVNALAKVDPETVLASYKNGQITKADLDLQLTKVPPQYQGRFKTISGQQEFLERLALEAVWYQEAIEHGYDTKPEVIQKNKDALKNQYITAYQTDKIDPNVKDKQLKDYYNDKKDTFIQASSSDIFYIQPENDSTAAVAINQINSGTDEVDVLNAYSVNKTTRESGGYIRGISNRGFIRGIGVDATLDSLIANTPVDIWQGPVTTKTGIHIFKVVKRKPARQRTFEEVKSDIERVLLPIEREKIYKDLVIKLKKRFKTTLHEQKLEQIVPDSLDSWKTIFNTEIVSSDIPELAMTGEQLYQIYNRIPPRQKAAYSSASGLANLITNQLNNELIYQAALADGYQSKVEQTEEAKRIMMVNTYRAYITDVMAKSPEPTEQDLKDWYNNHPDNFKTIPYRNIRQFVFDSKEVAEKTLQAAKDARYTGGFLGMWKTKLDNEQYDQELIKLVQANSSKPENDGLVENVYDNGLIPGLGREPEYNTKVFKTPVGELSDLFANSKNDKLVFFYVVSDNQGELKPFDEVKYQVSQQMHAEFSRKAFEDASNKVKANMQLQMFPERLEVKLTAEELFNLAAEAQKMRNHSDAVRYYDEIIKSYANGSDDYKATFMKGFLYAEDIGEPQKAVETFNELLTKFPEGDLHESARYMIKFIEEGDAPLPIEE